MHTGDSAVAYIYFLTQNHMQTCERAKTLFVGVDVHKDTHTAVGLSPFGEKLFELTIGNYPQDFAELAKKVNSTAQNENLSPRLGLEDCQGFGQRLASYLNEAGYSVSHVAPILVDHKRKKAAHPEKNDSLDARGVAEVMIQKIDTLPVHKITQASEIAKDIQELSLDREYLVKEQTRLKNQLHLLLHRIWNTEYREKFKDPFSVKGLRYWKKSVPKNTSDFLKRNMKRKVKKLENLRLEIKELESDMETLIEKSSHTIHTANGCGIVLAAMIIGEIGDISRFKSPAALAKYAGCAPREHSSGKTHRHRKTRSGNRRLNCAFHRLALSQISRMGNEKAKIYFLRKISEGRSKQQALVCLRRQIVNIIWMMMKHKTDYNLQKS